MPLGFLFTMTCGVNILFRGKDVMNSMKCQRLVRSQQHKKKSFTLGIHTVDERYPPPDPT
jgi:hypothetical protein